MTKDAIAETAALMALDVDQLRSFRVHERRAERETSGVDIVNGPSPSYKQ